MKLRTAMVAVAAATAVACSAFDGETIERANASRPEGASLPTSTTPQPDATTEAPPSAPQELAPPAPAADGGVASPPSACPPAAAEDGGACPNGGSRWNGRCYFVIPGLVGNLTARSACAAAGATLATFTCAEEWDALVVPAPSNYWIGATWDGASATWRWTNGEPFAFVPPGGPFVAAPPALAAQACLWVDQNGRWITADCASRSAHALCEVP